jgi:hypothetical protein
MARQPEGQACRNCRYYQERSRHILPDGRIGYIDSNMVCKRNPPIIGHIENVVYGWPQVAAHQWCGEYAPADPETVSEGAMTMARLVLLGDLTGARALADYLKEGGS